MNEDKCYIETCGLLQWNATIFCERHMADYSKWVQQGKLNGIKSFAKAGGLRAMTIEDIEFEDLWEGYDDDLQT